MEMCTNISLMLKLQKIRNSLTQATRHTTVLFGKQNSVTSACSLNSQSFNGGAAGRQERESFSRFCRILGETNILL
jgi:hypothetical protein